MIHSALDPVLSLHITAPPAWDSRLENTWTGGDDIKKKEGIVANIF